MRLWASAGRVGPGGSDSVWVPLRVSASALLVWVVLALGLSPPTALAGAVINEPDYLGLPPRPTAVLKAQTPARIALGQKLFFDRRLSVNGTQSCAMCHVPEQGFTTHTSSTSVGMAGRSLRRNAPSLFNVAWQARLFHDGRAASLEEQAWMPLLHEDEMANPSVAVVLARLAALPDYAKPFRLAFGSAKPSQNHVAAALAAFQRSLVLANSRFDAWRYGADSQALSAQEQQGFALFTGRAGCSVCHLVGAQSALFTDQAFHNTGLPMPTEMRSTTVELSDQLRVQLSPEQLAPLGDAPLADWGRFEVTQRAADRQAFKTPSLRNVALTAPYMHNGSITSLAAVIDFYDLGGGDAPGKSERLKPLHLSATDKQALLAFLNSLTGRPLVSNGPAQPSQAQWVVSPETSASSARRTMLSK
jgi:cytochrome c peroxidase